MARKPTQRKKPDPSKPRKPGPPHDVGKREAYIAAFAKLGNHTAAALAVGCATSSHRQTWKHDPEYMKKFKAAKIEAIERLEMEARRRAVEGVQRLKFHEGQMITIPAQEGEPGAVNVGTAEDPNWIKPYIEHDYSDTLMIFLLKANKPRKYRERFDVSNSGTVQHELKMYGRETPVDRV